MMPAKTRSGIQPAESRTTGSASVAAGARSQSASAQQISNSSAVSRTCPPMPAPLNCAAPPRIARSTSDAQSAPNTPTARNCGADTRKSSSAPGASTPGANPPAGCVANRSGNVAASGFAQGAIEVSSPIRRGRRAVGDKALDLRHVRIHHAEAPRQVLDALESFRPRRRVADGLLDARRELGRQRRLQTDQRNTCFAVFQANLDAIGGMRVSTSTPNSW